MAGSAVNLVNQGPADIAIVTSYGYSARETYAKISNQIKDEYAAQHGYHFFADCSERLGPTGTRQNIYPVGMNVPIIGFIKLDLLLYTLPRYKAVVWMDADLLITNKERRLEVFLERMDQHADIGVCYDHNGFHSTVIFAKNTPRAQDYLWAANHTGRGFYLGDPWHEMTAMRNLWLDPNYTDLVHFFSAKELCPIRKSEYVKFGLPMNVGVEFEWEPGDFALHAAALSDGRRHRLFEHYADPENHHKEPPPGPDAENP
jgi:galactosyl transferase GMA12/MNN10 family